MTNVWQLQDAKSKFSELVNQALSQGVQIITRRGKKTAVILPFEDYIRLTQKQSGSLSQFLLNSPLHDSELNLDRTREYPRDIVIEP